MDRGCNFLSSHKSTKEVLKKSLLVTFPSLLTLDKCHTFFSSSFTSFCIFPSNTADPSWKHIQLKINFNLLKATEENWNLRKMKFYQVVKKNMKKPLVWWCVPLINVFYLFSHLKRSWTEILYFLSNLTFASKFKKENFDPSSFLLLPLLLITFR